MSKAAESWEEVTRNHPCEKCGKSGWCSRAGSSGVIICKRANDGTGVHKLDANGEDYWIYGLGGTIGSRVEVPKFKTTERATPDNLNRVYQFLQDELTLDEEHRSAVLERGFPEGDPDRRGYRTLPAKGRSALSARLVDRFGVNICATVPGLYIKQEDGREYWSFAGAAGMLIPVRDLEGRIVQYVSRLDDPGDYGKYSSISSAKHGGPGPGCPVHVPLFSGPRWKVRLTEGPLKGDLTTALSGILTIAISGVSGWRAAVPVLQEMKAREILLAFDADACLNYNVARALRDTFRELERLNFKVTLETWDIQDGKGIDDLLTAGKQPREVVGSQIHGVLEDLVYQARRASDPAFCAKDDRIIDARNRVQGLVVEVKDDPGAVFAPDAVAALALIWKEELALWARTKPALVKAKVPMRELTAAMNNALPDPAPSGYRGEAATDRDLYLVRDGRVCHETDTDKGPIVTPLCNFTAAISSQEIRDDGAERITYFNLEGELQSGAALPPVSVPSTQYPLMNWVTAQWGANAIVHAGFSTRDHLRAGIQILSGEVSSRVRYGHTGWREIEGDWLFLHAGGAIGASGLVETVNVGFGESRLKGYVLPAPLVGEALKAAVRASLGILHLTHSRVTYPLYCGIFRAPLCALKMIDCSFHLVGDTGSQKSELTALVQQHFGATFHAKHLPGNWSSTDNMLEKEAFLTKDVVFTIDDFAPTGSAIDIQQLHRKADRIFRGAGNSAGRGRMKADGTPRPEYYSRGLVISSGEEKPNGESAQSRVVILEVEKGSMNLELLTAAQKAAAAGLYAGVMSAYLQWLAGRYSTLAERLENAHTELRAHFRKLKFKHDRTPDNAAALALGLKFFLEFAKDAGALTEANAAAHWEAGTAALCVGAEAQSAHQDDQKPTLRFLSLLNAALLSGALHVADAEQSNAPDNAGRWGWQRMKDYTFHEEWQPRGPRIGWVDGNDLYIEPDAAYAAIQEFAGKQRSTLALTPQTLWKRLREGGYLASWDEIRDRNKVRKVVAGVRVYVVHLRVSQLANPTLASETEANQLSFAEIGPLSEAA